MSSKLETTTVKVTGNIMLRKNRFKRKTPERKRECENDQIQYFFLS